MRSFTHASKGARHERARSGPVDRRLPFWRWASVGWAGAASAGKSDNTLNVAFWREIVTLDGHYANLRENDILGLLVDDALFYVDHQSLKPVPLLAQVLPTGRRQDPGARDPPGGEVPRREPRDAPGRRLFPQHPRQPQERRNSYTLRVGLWLDRADAAGPATVRLNMKAPYAMALWDLCYYVKIRKDKIYDDPAKPGNSSRRPRP